MVFSWWITLCFARTLGGYGESRMRRIVVRRRGVSRHLGIFAVARRHRPGGRQWGSFIDMQHQSVERSYLWLSASLSTCRCIKRALERGKRSAGVSEYHFRQANSPYSVSFIIIIPNASAGHSSHPPHCPTLSPPVSTEAWLLAPCPLEVQQNLHLL
jgi:hypothetical protein